MAIDTTEANLYGINRGAAQVWDRNRGLDLLAQQYQQDQARKQKQEAQLGDELGKININAAREADLPELMKKYDGIKDTFFKLSQTKDNMERLKLQSQIMSQKQELMNGAALSKQAQQQESEFGKLPLNHPDDLADSFVPNYSKLRKTSIFDPKYKTQAEYLSSNSLLPKFDNMGYAKKILDSSIENIQGKEQRKKDGRLNYTVREEGSRLNYDNVLDKTTQAAMSDPRFRRQLLSTYQGVTPDQAVKLYAQDIYDQNKDAYNKVKEKNVRQYMDAAPNRYLQNRLIDLQLGIGKDKKQDDGVLYRQKTISDMLANKPGSGERLKSLLQAKGNYSNSELDNMIGAPKGSNFIEFRIPQKTIKYTNSDGEEVSKTLDKRTVLIDKRDKNSKIKLNELLSDLTGEKISESKVQTGQSSGKVSGTIYTEQGKQVSNKSNQSTVTMVMPNGATGEIPSDKVEAFLKKYPKARRQ